jgi:5'-3' exonuclease
MIKKNIKINILSNLNPLLLINLKKLYYINENKINNFVINTNFKLMKYTYDYVLLVLFLGNDYLPKLSNVNYENLILFYYIYQSFYNNYIIIDNKINYSNLINFLTIIIVQKKIKFSNKKLSYDNFLIYFNNLEWCLKIYKIFDNDLIFKPTVNPNDQLKTINIYNFINYYINN